MSRFHPHQKHEHPDAGSGGLAGGPWRKIIFRLAIGLGVAFAIAVTPVVFVTQLKSGEFLVSNYKMLEDDFNNPRLVLLRRREHLDKVVAPGLRQFEKIVLLRKWAHDLWEGGQVFYYPPWDAVEILDLVRQYNNKGFCAQTAIVFLQACQAMGIHARYVDLPGHFVVGVWSDDYNRWVVMDPSHDLHYERDGLPMKGRDMCNAYWNKDVKGIVTVSSDGTRSRVKREDLAIYRAYSISEYANQLAQPVIVIVNGVRKKLVHEDDFRRYPLVGTDEVGIESAFLAWKSDGTKEFRGVRPETADPDDFRYAKNQTLIFVARRNPRQGRVKLVLHPENSQTFKEYLFNLDGSGWQTSPTNEFLWGLNPGMNRLEVRIKTAFGWEGPVSRISLFYKPTYLIRR